MSFPPFVFGKFRKQMEAVVRGYAVGVKINKLLFSSGIPFRSPDKRQL
jgi:hypothetical protein